MTYKLSKLGQIDLVICV